MSTPKLVSRAHRAEVTLADEVATLKAQLAEARAWSSEDDRGLPEEEAIRNAHPLRTGRHDIYKRAMDLVRPRHSKFALVDLVNWLLSRAEAASEDALIAAWNASDAGKAAEAARAAAEDAYGAACDAAEAARDAAYDACEAYCAARAAYLAKTTTPVTP